MSARNKLNAAAVNGSVLVGALIGLAASSWSVFLLATALLIAGAWHSGAIRTGTRPRSPRPENGRQ